MELIREVWVGDTYLGVLRIEVVFIIEWRRLSKGMYVVGEDRYLRIEFRGISEWRVCGSEMELERNLGREC